MRERYSPGGRGLIGLGESLMHPVVGQLHAHLDVAIGTNALFLHETFAVRGRYGMYLNVVRLKQRHRLPVREMSVNTLLFASTCKLPQPRVIVWQNRAEGNIVTDQIGNYQLLMRHLSFRNDLFQAIQSPVQPVVDRAKSCGHSQSDN